MSILFLILLLSSFVLSTHIQIPAGDSSLIHDLYSHGFTIGRVTNTTWDVYTNNNSLDVLNTYTNYTLVREQRSLPNMLGYTNTVSLVNFCEHIEESYPRLAKKIIIGYSVQQKPLVGIILSSKKKTMTDMPKKKFLYFGNIHGDETVGRELLIRFITHMCEQYGVNSQITTILDKYEIHIIPSVNPDGFERGIRTNIRGYDLNRNYHDRFYGQISRMQPETLAVTNWCRQHRFSLGANLHGGSLVVNYPYDGNAQHRSGVYTPTKDDALFKRIAKSYSMYNREMKNSVQFKEGITNGSFWYILYGGFQDWIYTEMNVKTVTIEVSKIKHPHGYQLPLYWEKNREALINYIFSLELV